MKQKRKTIKIKPLSTVCHYCENKTEVEYKDVSVMGRFLSERGKLLSAERTGMCSAHQRDLQTAVKRARHVALLPFVVRAS